MCACMIYSATGHRKTNLSDDDLVSLAYWHLLSTGPKRVIVGMALGWDMAVAEAARLLGVPYWAAVPFDGQHNRWPDDQVRRYRHLLYAADAVHVICPHFSMKAYEDRNRWMIDRCDRVMAYWDGSVSGGTANAIRYSRKKNKPVDNLCVPA